MPITHVRTVTACMPWCRNGVFSRIAFLLSHCSSNVRSQEILQLLEPEASILGELWVTTTRFWAEGVAGRSWTGREIIIIIAYHVQDVCSRVVTFEEK